ncbi:MAG: DNA repair protein RecO [Polyangiaceae bacterium]
MNSRTESARDVDAYLLRRTEFGEADLVLFVFTLQLGNVSVMARSARKSTRRFSGALEPFHRILLRISPPRSGELHQLREARIEEVRHALVADLRAMDVAGRVLGWVRRTLPPATPEPEVFGALDQLFTRLNARLSSAELNGDALLAEFGLTLLRHLGWALQLDHCVRCGRVCPPNAPAMLDPHRGGLVCRNCGGARLRIDANLRLCMADGSYEALSKLNPIDTTFALDLVDKALRAHPGLEGD